MKIITQARCQVQVESVNHYFVKKIYRKFILSRYYECWCRTLVCRFRVRFWWMRPSLGLVSSLSDWNSKAVYCSIQFKNINNLKWTVELLLNFNHSNWNPNLCSSTRTKLRTYKQTKVWHQHYTSGGLDLFFNFCYCFVILSDIFNFSE